MHFDARKVAVVGGSAGIGGQAALEAVGHGGSTVIGGPSHASTECPGAPS